MGHLDALAQEPRPAGSDAAARGRAYCAKHLRSIGFTVSEHSFEFSALPGRFGAPIVGGIGAGLLCLTMWNSLAGDRERAVTALVVALVTTIAFARFLGGDAGTRLPFLRRSAVNLEARRGTDPRVWLVAHIDSKSQPISTAVRTLATILLIVAAVVATVLVIVWPTGPLAWAWVLVGVAASAGGVLLLSAFVTARSNGAVDNASGVAAVLDAAAQVPVGKSFGVLITDAEELALAGARAWVRGRGPGVAINCDTVDDDGQLVVLRYGPATETVLQRASIAVEAERGRVIRPFPGVLTDSVAFRDAGWETVTLGRGSLRTLRRIHTPHDNLQALRGTGIPVAARVLARLVEELA